MELEKCSGPQDLAQRAARLFLDSARWALAERGGFHVALSGGNTPRATHEAIAGLDLPWEKVFFYWGDERAVPPTDSSSNYRMARETLLDRIKIPSENIHRMKADHGAPDLEQGCRDYEAVIAQIPGGVLDFTLLGIGDDGHTASLFPGHPTIEAKENVVGDPIGQKGMARLSLTFPFINRSRKIVFLVEGDAKAEPLSGILKKDSRYPASRVQPESGELFWFIDPAAADRL